MKLWQAITLIVFTFVFFWLLACYGATGKPKRCQTCCPIAPSPTYLSNSLPNAYEITLPVNEEVRKMKMTITENHYGNEVIKYKLEDVKTGKVLENAEGLLYYNDFAFTLFAIIDDPKYPDSPIMRTLDCDITVNDEPQAKGICVFIGAKPVAGLTAFGNNVPDYKEVPIVLDRR